jgi:hypothetical protein
MAAPTTVTYTFSGSGGPITFTIPAGIDYTLFVRNAFIEGGFWYTSATGVATFVPWSTVTGATAQ